MSDIKNGFLALAVLVLGAGGLWADGRPNIVFILVDDLGYGDLGSYGSTFYETPRLDALAAEGTRFTQAYAASPVCSPTRAALLTGRYPSRVDITDWIPGANLPDKPLREPEDRDNLALEEETLAETLHAAGYETFFAGKWHLGKEGHFPEDQGFEHNRGGHDRGTPPGGYYAPFKNPRLEDKQGDHYLTDRLTDESIAFLGARDRDRPFLLYLAYYTVHTPIQGCDAYDAYFEAKAAALEGAPPPLAEGDAWTRSRQDNPAYAAMVKSLDTNVGRLLDALEAYGLTSKTLVIFTSDNGGLSTQGKPGPTSVLPLRAGKGWCYEGGIRVPLIIRAPALEQTMRVSVEPAISMDIFPTMLAYAGLEPRPDLHLDGLNLLPALRGEPLARDTLFWHYPHYHNSKWQPGAALRHRDWKLVHSYHHDRAELFNLATDPGERHDLAASRPDKLRELAEKLASLQLATGARLPTPYDKDRQ